MSLAHNNTHNINNNNNNRNYDRSTTNLDWDSSSCKHLNILTILVCVPPLFLFAVLSRDSHGCSTNVAAAVDAATSCAVAAAADVAPVAVAVGFASFNDAAAATAGCTHIAAVDNNIIALPWRCCLSSASIGKHSSVFVCRGSTGRMRDMLSLALARPVYTASVTWLIQPMTSWPLSQLSRAESVQRLFIDETASRTERRQPPIRPSAAAANFCKCFS